MSQFKGDFWQQFVEGVLVNTWRGLPIGNDGCVTWNGMRLRPCEIIAEEAEERLPEAFRMRKRGG